MSSAPAQECDTGIPGVGRLPWGSHVCNFYNDADDLAECLVPFFHNGLDKNEMCFWIASDPLNARDAKRRLSEVCPNLDELEASGQMTILDFTDWYLAPDGSVTVKALRDGLNRIKAAQHRGYAGVRMSGNSFWLERKNWALFSQYEQELQDALRGSRIVILCSYSLRRLSPRDRLEVLRHHDFAISRGLSGWQLSRTSKSDI